MSKKETVLTETQYRSLKPHVKEKLGDVHFLQDSGPICQQTTSSLCFSDRSLVTCRVCISVLRRMPDEPTQTDLLG